MIPEKKSKLKEEIFAKIKEYYSLYLKSNLKSIPASSKKYDEKELIAIVDAALDGWWTEGRVTLEFEKKFCKYLNIKHTLVVNSGSSANLIALKTLTSRKLGEKRLIEGDEIISVAAGFPTTINPIIQCGCIPVFCDIDLPTYNIKVEQIENAISNKTKAIFIAHTLGNPFDLKTVKTICDKHNLWLIEDCCDALGAKYDDKLVGTFGDISTFSFYPAHHITMGEGGAVCTNNSKLYKISRSFRDWGRDCWCSTGEDNTCQKRFGWKMGNLPAGYDHKYVYSEIGYNLKNTDLNVAIGLAQLDKLNEFIKARQTNFNSLLKKFSEFTEYFILQKSTFNSEPSWFGFLITLKDNCPFRREELLEYLNAHNIGTRLLFAGNITKQPYFIENDIKYKLAADLTNTDKVMKNTFWLGVYPLMSEEHINQIVSTLSSFIKQYVLHSK